MKLHPISDTGSQPSLDEQRIHMLSHELRTPLAVISGFAQLLKSELSQEQVDLITPILENADKLQRVISNVLEHEETWSDDSYPANCDVVKVVEEMVSKARPNAQHRGMSIHHVKSLAAGSAYTDVGLIQRALSQLLDNAIKFSDSGDIRIETRIGPDTITIEVSDEGIGLPEKTAQLFSPFVQGSTGLDRTHHGLGLGLSLAQKAAGRLSGSISLHNRLGGGTLARLTFRRFAHVSVRRVA